jgi:hypothetical protein
MTFTCMDILKIDDPMFIYIDIFCTQLPIDLILFMDRNQSQKYRNKYIDSFGFWEIFLFIHELEKILALVKNVTL